MVWLWSTSVLFLPNPLVFAGCLPNQIGSLPPGTPCGRCPTCAEGKIHLRTLQRWVRKPVLEKPHSKWIVITFQSCTQTHSLFYQAFFLCKHDTYTWTSKCSCYTGVALSERALQIALQQWSWCSCRCLLGTFISVRWTQRQNPDSNWLGRVPQAGGVAHVRNRHANTSNKPCVCFTTDLGIKSMCVGHSQAQWLQSGVSCTESSGEHCNRRWYSDPGSVAPLWHAKLST